MKTTPSRFRAHLLLVMLALVIVLASGVSTRAASVTTLHNFSTTVDGTAPFAELVQGNDGKFYGTVSNGGSGNQGAIFSITPAGVFTTLHALAGTDGTAPYGALVQGGDGTFYGTAVNGGSSGEGTIFSVTPAGVFTVLHSFSGAATEGATPDGSLVLASDGKFYGTTQFGGPYGAGTTFSITPAGVFTDLHDFNDGFGFTEGATPSTALVEGNDGNFYGATNAGGSNNLGTIFKTSPGGALEKLHDFVGTSTDSSTPLSLIKGSDGNFYGTTLGDGSSDDGTIFQITPTGTLTFLHRFSGPDGIYPNGRLLQDSDGNLYGTTITGGTYNKGTIFVLTPAGVLTTLYHFGGTTGDGFGPQAGLVKGSDGNFYGTARSGGTFGSGTVYRLSLTSAAGAVQFNSATANTAENAGSVTLTVQRTGGSVGAVSVNYATSDGTAAAGLDYAVTAGTLSWADGDSADKTFTVPILDRHVSDDSTKTFSVVLNAPTGGVTLGTPVSSTVSILDNDVAPAPSIAITSPPKDITVVVGVPVPLAANVTDPGGVLDHVQFFVNDIPYATTTSAGPFMTTAAAPFAGTFVLEAVATDTQGRTSTSTVTITAIAADPANPAPAASLVTPLDGRDLDANATLTLDATADSAAALGLDHVDIYVDGVIVKTFTTAEGSAIPATHAGTPTRRDASKPLSKLFTTDYKMPGIDKILNMIVTATDKLGHTSVSGVAAFHSKLTTDRAPLVTIGGLTNGAHVKAKAASTAPVTASDPDATPSSAVRADASGDATLAKLEYYLNGSLVGQAVKPPFNLTFTPPAAGKYLLHAVATDASGLSTVSEPVEVEADAVTPTVNLAVGGSGAAVEGGANGVIVVTRTGGDNTAALTVSYKTKGAAKPGVDYKPLPGKLTIPAGAAKAKIKVKPINGSPNAGTLKLKLQLLPSPDGSYVVGASPIKLKLIGK